MLPKSPVLTPRQNKHTTPYRIQSNYQETTLTTQNPKHCYLPNNLTQIYRKPNLYTYLQFICYLKHLQMYKHQSLPRKSQVPEHTYTNPQKEPTTKASTIKITRSTRSPNLPQPTTKIQHPKCPWCADCPRLQNQT